MNTFKKILEAKEDITFEKFNAKVTSAFKKHFPNGFIQINQRKSFGDNGDYFVVRFGMIGNPRDNSNGIPENDKMGHTVTIQPNGDGSYVFKSSGRVYTEPKEGSYNAMDSIKTKLGNKSKVTIDKASDVLVKFFPKLSKIMQDNKDIIFGVKQNDIKDKYLIFK